jgi:hypothetical protein
LAARVSSAGVVAWYATDRQGSVRAITNGSGTLIDTVTYDGFGNVASESNSANGDRYKYTGRDLETAAPYCQSWPPWVSLIQIQVYTRLRRRALEHALRTSGLPPRRQGSSSSRSAPCRPLAAFLLRPKIGARFGRCAGAPSDLAGAQSDLAGALRDIASAPGDYSGARFFSLGGIGVHPGN